MDGYRAALDEEGKTAAKVAREFDLGFLLTNVSPRNFRYCAPAAVCENITQLKAAGLLVHP